MKVVVAGATGKQGRGALWYLLRQKDVSRIVAAARGVDNLKELVAGLGDKRLVAQFINLSDIEGTTKVFRGADVVINCAYEGYPTDENYVNLKLNATKAALEAGIHYTELGGAPPEPEQLALSEGFKGKGILAILGVGALTGLIQIMAAYAINRLDVTDSIDVKSGARDLIPHEEHSGPLACWDLVAEEKGKARLSYVSHAAATRFRYGTDSVSYENGKLLYDPPRAYPEVFEFREPIGAVSVAQTPNAAVISLSQCFPGTKHISMKTSEDPDFETKVNFLRELGFFSTEPIIVQGQVISAWDVLIALLAQIPHGTIRADIRRETRVKVKGKEAGKEVEYTLRSLPVGDKVAQAGLRTAIAAVMLNRGQIKGIGISMPEICIPSDQYLDELVGTGVEDIEITRKVRL